MKEMVKLGIPASILARRGNGGSSPTWTNTLTMLEIERERAEKINETAGGVTGYDCPDCLNRGYFVRVDEQGRRWSEECRCMAIRHSRERLERSGLKDLVARYRFETWQVKERWQKGALAMARQFVEDPAGRWFLMTGQVGAGKSHLCTAVTGALLEKGMPARYMLWRDTAVKAKAVVNDDAAYAAIVEPLKRIKVLYIDDLFKGAKVTQGDINLAFELLNSRYNDSGKITILSSEKLLEELLEIDEAVGSRIYERSEGFRLELSGVKNWRLWE